MNMREAREAYGIEQWIYSENFLEATRSYENDVRNFERAYERISGNGKTVRRKGTRSKKPSVAVGEESGAVT